MNAEEWQPIETAPRDGMHIFLWLEKPNGHLRSHVYETFWLVMGWADEYGNSIAKGDWFKPTHWMPLPAPPPYES